MQSTRAARPTRLGGSPGVPAAPLPDPPRNDRSGRMKRAIALPTLNREPLVDAARLGDGDAFRRLVEPLYGQLYGHCRRMLASAQDAEDAMQEVLFRAWRALATYEGRAPLRSWLYRIATNVCLDAIQQRPAEVVSLDERLRQAPAESSAAEPDAGIAILTDYEHREAAGLALGVTLDRLPAKQRAVLILRDVLGFSARETASSLETTTTAVNSALQRARANLDHGLERDRLQLSPRALGGRRLQDAVEGFVAALWRGYIDTLVGIAVDETLSDERSWPYSPAPVY